MTIVHGIIFKQFKNFVRDDLRGVDFDDLRVAADVERTIYMSTRSYGDDEFAALLEAAADATGRSTDDLLVDLGAAATPELLRMYHAQIDDDWGPLDLIERAPAAITEVVTLRDPDAKQVEFTTERVADDTVSLEYASSRELCGLAKGVARGLGDNYGEPVEVTESRCQHEGARACALEFTVDA